jgi:cytosine/adenosine deaminase-related metal-dependent hydrolase
MSTLLVKHASVVVTMDNFRSEIPDGGLYIRDGFIEQIGFTKDLPASADRVLDLTGSIVAPGLFNTHHHFYQTLTGLSPLQRMLTSSTGLRRYTPLGEMKPEHIRISSNWRWLN